jgi:hypothetical protein
MKSMRGSVDGLIIATYRKGKFTWNCRFSNGFYCATFNNGRQTNQTYYSEDKQEINDLIRKEIAKGFKRVK